LSHQINLLFLYVFFPVAEKAFLIASKNAMQVAFGAFFTQGSTGADARFVVNAHIILNILLVQTAVTRCW